MRKNYALKGLIALQAICMIILTVMIVIKMVMPVKAPVSIEDAGKAGSGIIIATVGSEQITDRELRDHLEHLYGQQVLHTIMVRSAIRQEAEAYELSVSAQELEEELSRMMHGYEGEADFYRTMKDQLGLTKEDVQEDAEYRLLLEKIAIRPIVITEDEVLNYLDSHPELFAPRISLRLAWIVTESLRLAEQALEELYEGEEFAKLAKRYSIDSFTADYGGEIGYIESDDPFIDENVLEAAAKLEVGGIAGPIAVEDGYAIIYLTERQTATELDERKLMESVRQQLALAASKPLIEVEQDLLVKYNAEIRRTP